MSAQPVGLDLTAVWLLIDRFPLTSAMDQDEKWIEFEKLQRLEQVELIINNIKTEGKDVVLKMNQLIEAH